MTIMSPRGQTYPTTVTNKDGYVIWDVSESDLGYAGNGLFQLTFTKNNEVIKTAIGSFVVEKSLSVNGEPPDPIDNWLDNATEALADMQTATASIESMTASAQTLPTGSTATATVTDVNGHKNIAFGIPQGPQGEPGTPGQDGVSPTATVTQTATGATITVTDAQGTTTAEISNGQDGEPGSPGPQGIPGTPGQDGVSPTITISDITGGHRVTITDATGPHSFDVMDGDVADAPVQDVQVGGVSVLRDGVANVRMATSTVMGAVILGDGFSTDSQTKKKRTLILQVQPTLKPERPRRNLLRHIASIEPLSTASPKPLVPTWHPCPAKLSVSTRKHRRSLSRRCWGYMNLRGS